MNLEVIRFPADNGNPADNGKPLEITTRTAAGGAMESRDRTEILMGERPERAGAPHGKPHGKPRSASDGR